MAELVAAALFALLLITACVRDVSDRRVPNWLVATLAVLGLLYSTGRGTGISGLLWALAGLVIGLVIWLPSWLMRWLGAGDVKLFAAAGAWLGPVSTLEAAVWAGLIGGLLSLAWLLRYRGIRGTVLTLSVLRIHPKGAIQRDRVDTARKPLPYAIALAAGAAIAALFPRLIF